LAAVFFFGAGFRRALAFFFAVFAMLRPLFLIAQIVILPKTNRQYLPSVRCRPNVNWALTH
jgi:hypothetical protein